MARGIGAMSLTSVVAFWAVSLLFALTPGADWAYAIAAGLRHRTVVPAVTGMLLGHLAAIVAVAAGVASIMAAAPVAMTVLTAAGAAYLIWLGIGTVARPSLPRAGETGQTRSAWQELAKGFGVSGLNPKVFLLILALLPQFTDASAAWPAPVQIVVLGAVHLLNSAVVYLAVGSGARKVLRTRPAIARWVSRLSGAAMIVIGTVMIVQELVP